MSAPRYVDECVFFSVSAPRYVYECVCFSVSAPRYVYECVCFSVSAPRFVSVVFAFPRAPLSAGWVSKGRLFAWGRV